MVKILEAKGLKKPKNELRNETANAIESNNEYSKALEAQKWIQDKYPNEANRFLFNENGTEFNVKLVEKKEQYLTDEDKKK